MKNKITICAGTLLFFGIMGVVRAAAWPADAKPIGKAVLDSKSSSTVTGTVEFAENKKGWLIVHASISGATPGDHGIHIHAVGDCSDPDAKKAGDHFNPTGDPHGDPNTAKHHAGDLGNLVADSSGKAEFEITLKAPAHHGFKNWTDVVGKSIVVHETKDDLKTQPSGASGKRVACGVINQVMAF
jgi:superoxide dismutase, Cu-Zn family